MRLLPLLAVLLLTGCVEQAPRYSLGSGEAGVFRSSNPGRPIGLATIKGMDEADSSVGEVSWIAPIARALLKARVGDEVQLSTPGGIDRVEVLDVRYPAPTAD